MPEARRRVVGPPQPVEPVEYQAEFTGMEAVQMYRCPRCGRSGQDRKQIEAHIATHGGEE